MSSSSTTPETGVQPSGAVSTDETEQRASVDFAWKVQSLNLDWIARVDSKAWILVTLVGANLLLVYNLSLPGKLFDHLGPVSHTLLVMGITLLALSCVASVLVVVPALRTSLTSALARWWRRRRHTTIAQPSQLQMIYFGDLVEAASSDDVEASLRALTLDQELAMLAKQLLALSQINWYKHLLLRLSVYVWVGGVALLLLAAL